MFEGYLEFSNIPLINAEQTEAFVAHQAPGMPFRPRIRTDRIHIAVEDEPYQSPADDDVEWFNPAEPATADFYGLYPMEITGDSDSKLTASVTESTSDGGSAGTPREGSRTIRVHGLLVAANRLAAETGLSWLRNVLKTETCGMDDSCGAGDLRYFVAEPEVCKELYSEVENPPQTQTFGALRAPETVSIRWAATEVPPAAPVRARWSGSYGEAVTFVYGAKARGTKRVLEQSEWITPRRVNYALNPTFHSSTVGWTAGGGSHLTWSPTGGVRDDGYAQVTIGSLYGEGLYGDGLYGAGSATTPGLMLGVKSTNFTVPAGPVTASVALRAGTRTEPIRVELVDAITGKQIVATETLPGADWARASVTGTAGTGQVSLVVSSTESFDLDEVLIEIGALALPYFDGDSVFPDSVAAWRGARDASASTLHWDGILETNRNDYRPFFTVLQGTVSNLSVQWWTRDPVPIEEQLLPYERIFHNVQCIQGVQVISRAAPVSGGYFIEVDFLLVAGNPYPFSVPRPVPTVVLASGPYVDPEADPTDTGTNWLFDPSCLLPTPPPLPPGISMDCVETVTKWQRSYVPIPAEDISLWASTVPTIGINTHTDAITQLRVRVHPNPFGYPPEQVDPAAFCSEFIVSYLPPLTRLAVNGMTSRAVASKGGKTTVSADHLLFGSGGGPMTWPELTCGVPYVLTIDVPQGGDVNAFDVDLTMARKG